MKKKSVFIGFVVVIIIAACAVLYASKSEMISTLTSGESGSGHFRGSRQAKVQIVEFSDFQCPACQRAQPVLDEIKSKYGDQVAIIFKHFPLDGHLWASVAHQAAECAGEQGKFWEYHDRLYDEQSKWSGPTNPLETFIRYGRDLKLNLKSFGSCMSDEKVKERIYAQRAEGEQLKVRSTPTLFIGDERVVGPVQLKVKGEEIVRKALNLPPLEHEADE